ncbi:hypothetical protein [Actinoplanes sp. NPDC049316]|uniref:hypothetical protein n=1 Tax=Actinoplanes sp. NPDC049316 TaxID=3154727 RepID=UPI0034435E1D
MSARSAWSPSAGWAEAGAALPGKNADRSAGTDARPDGPLTGAELGTEADPLTGAELGIDADPLTGAEVGTDAEPETGFAASAGSGAHRAPAAGGGGSSYP